MADRRQLRRGLWMAISAICILAPYGPACGQEPSGDQTVPLDFAAASARFDGRSSALSGADHSTRAARETEAAVRALHRPIVTASAQLLEYQKTLSLDLTGPKQDALGDTQQYLSDLPSTLPPGFQDIAAAITAVSSLHHLKDIRASGDKTGISFGQSYRCCASLQFVAGVCHGKNAGLQKRISNEFANLLAIS